MCLFRFCYQNPQQTCLCSQKILNIENHDILMNYDNFYDKKSVQLTISSMIPRLYVIDLDHEHTGSCIKTQTQFQ